MIKVWLVMLTSIIAVVSSVEAGRPFATSSTGIVEKAKYEFEMGSDFWSDESYLGMEFKHGLTERMEIGVAVGYTIEPEVQERLSAAELGLKFAIIRKLLATSISGEFGASAYSIKGIIGKGIGPLTIDANVGYKASGVSELAGSVFYSAALIYRIYKFRFGFESTGDKDGLQTWLVGSNYKVRDGFAVDTGISGGYEEGDGKKAKVGICYEF